MEHQEGGEDSGSTRTSKSRRRHKVNRAYSASDTHRTSCGRTLSASGADEMSTLPQDKDFLGGRDGNDRVTEEAGGDDGRPVEQNIAHEDGIGNEPPRRRNDRDRSNRNGGTDAPRRRKPPEAIPLDPPVAVPVDVDESESEAETPASNATIESASATTTSGNRSSQKRSSAMSYERLMEKYVACRSENENLKQDVHLMIETSSQLTQQHRADVARATKERDIFKQELSKVREELTARIATLEDKARKDREKFQSLQEKYSRTKYEYHKLKEQQKAMAAQFDEEYENLRVDNLRLRDALTQQAKRNAATGGGSIGRSGSVDGDMRTVGSRRSTGSFESKESKGKGNNRDWKQEYYYEKKYRELKQEHQALLQQVGGTTGNAHTRLSSGVSLDGMSATPSYAASQASQTFIPVELQSPSPPPASIGSPSINSNTPSSSGKEDRNYGKGGFKKHTKTSKWAMLTATASTVAAAKRAASAAQSNQQQITPSSPSIASSESSRPQTSQNPLHPQVASMHYNSNTSRGSAPTPTSLGLPSVQEHNADIDHTFPRSNSLALEEPQYRHSTQTESSPRFRQQQQLPHQAAIPQQAGTSYPAQQSFLHRPRYSGDYDSNNNGDNFTYGKSAQRVEAGSGRYGGGRAMGTRPQYQSGRGSGGGPPDFHESFGTESTQLSSLTSGSAMSSGLRNGVGPSAAAQQYQYSIPRQQQIAKQNSPSSRSSRAPRSRLG